MAGPPVAVVNANAKNHGTEKLAQAYLQSLYTPAAQDAIARNFSRPRDPKVAAKYAGVFPQLNLVTIGKDFGSWKAAQVKYFKAGGVFDKIFEKAKNTGTYVMVLALRRQLQHGRQ